MEDTELDAIVVGILQDSKKGANDAKVMSEKVETDIFFDTPPTSSKPYALFHSYLINADGVVLYDTGEGGTKVKRPNSKETIKKAKELFAK